jgi:hypothetical protein
MCILPLWFSDICIWAVHACHNPLALVMFVQNMTKRLPVRFRQVAIMFESDVASTMCLAYCNYRKEV